MMSDLQESLMLWLPRHLVADPEERMIVTKANGLVMDLLDQDISLEQLFDEFNTLGVDLDDYTDTLETVLKL